MILPSKIPKKPKKLQMEIDYKLLLNYEDIFGSANSEVGVRDFLKLVPRDRAIQVGLLISNSTDEISAEEDILRLGFNKTLPPIVLFTILNRPLDLASCKLELTNPQTGLELLRQVFSILPTDIKRSSNPSKSDYALLMAILKINGEMLKNSSGLKDSSILKFHKSIQSRKYSLDSRIVLYPSYFRFLMLLKFFKNADDKWKNLWELFIMSMGMSTEIEYANAIGTLIDNIPYTPRKNNIIFRYEKSGFMTKLMDDLSISISDIIPLTENIDYTRFKQKPFIKLANYEYGVIDNRFVSNLLYTSVRFKLSSIARASGFIRNFPSQYNTDFLQNFLFSELLDYIYKGRGYVFKDVDSKNTQEMAERRAKSLGLTKHKTEELKCSPPDGYFREGRKVLLFECKGILMSQKAISDKEECDRIIHENLFGKKGDGQLTINCDRIQQRQFLWDEVPNGRIKIYPILLCDDSIFSADGFNRYGKELSSKKGTAQSYPLTVLDMDTLILSADLIREGRIDIFSEIETYHKYCDRKLKTHRYTPEEILHCKDISFSAFLMSRYELKSPSIIKVYENELGL